MSVEAFNGWFRQISKVINLEQGGKDTSEMSENEIMAMVNSDPAITVRHGDIR